MLLYSVQLDGIQMLYVVVERDKNKFPADSQGRMPQRLTNHHCKILQGLFLKFSHAILSVYTPHEGCVAGRTQVLDSSAV